MVKPRGCEGPKVGSAAQDDNRICMGTRLIHHPCFGDACEQGSAEDIANQEQNAADDE